MRLHINETKPGRLKNEDGIALITALLLGLIGMMMVVSLVLLVNNGTWMSGSKGRYQMDLNAAYGGMDFFSKEVIQRGLGGTPLSGMGTYGGIMTPVASDGDFQLKLTTTGILNDGVYPNDPIDMTLTLAFPTGGNIAVNSTIASTCLGNSGTSSNNLVGGGVVNNNSGNITPQHIPYLYQIETQGQSAANPKENAQVSALYIY